MISKHKITVILNWIALEKDIRDKIYKSAKTARISTKDTVEADTIENIVSLKEEDTYMLKRSMTQSLSDVITMCGRYIWEKEHTADNNLMADGDIDITLMMPLNFNLAGCRSLGQAIHAYITSKTLSEWYRYTLPSKAEEHNALSELAKMEIKKILSARIKLDSTRESKEIIISQ